MKSSLKNVEDEVPHIKTADEILARLQEDAVRDESSRTMGLFPYTLLQSIKHVQRLPMKKGHDV